MATDGHQPDRLRAAQGCRGHQQKIDAAIQAVLADGATGSRLLAKGWMCDLLETIRTNARTAEALETDKAASQRNRVRTTILLAHPVKR